MGCDISWNAFEAWTSVLPSATKRGLLRFKQPAKQYSSFLLRPSATLASNKSHQPPVGHQSLKSKQTI